MNHYFRVRVTWLGRGLWLPWSARCGCGVFMPHQYWDDAMRWAQMHAATGRL